MRLDGWQDSGHWKLMHCFVTGFGFDARNFQDAGGAFTLLYWLRDTDYTDYRLMYTQWIEADILILKAIDFFFLLYYSYFSWCGHLHCIKGPINISTDWRLPAAGNRGQMETDLFFMGFSLMDRALQLRVDLHWLPFIFLSFVLFIQTQSLSLASINILSITLTCSSKMCWLIM